MRGIAHQWPGHEECVGGIRRHRVRRQLAEPFPHLAAPLAVLQQQEELHEVEAGAEAVVLEVALVVVLGVVVLVVVGSVGEQLVEDVVADVVDDKVDVPDGGAIDGFAPPRQPS